MQRKILLTFATFFLFLFSFVFPKTSFAATFALSGSAKDNSNNAIVGATIDVLNPGTTTVVEATTTDSSGSYSVSVDEGSYDVRVTPPSESGFGPAIALSQNITANKVLNFILVPAGVITLSGHVYDPFGNPLENQTVNLGNVNATTNVFGEYSMQTSSGTYSLNIFGSNNSSSQNIPQSYQLSVSGYQITQSTVLDITIPAKKVDINVQDSFAVGIPDVEAVTRNGGRSVGNVSIGGGINNASSLSYYGRSLQGGSLPGPKTNQNGDITLWLLPSNAGNPFRLTFTPPAESGYLETSIQNVVITNDTQMVATLQEPVALSGHVYDLFGNPLESQSVALGGSITSTNSLGEYSLQVSPGSYSLTVSGSNNSSSLNIPQSYQLSVSGYQITQSTVLDFTIPAKRVNIHIQDALGNPIQNVEVATLNGGKSVGNVVISGGINNASSLSYYGRSLQGGSLPGPKTNASGDVILWLLPSDAGNPFTIKFIPPNGSSFIESSLTNVVVTDDSQKLVTLQQPVTLSGHVYDSSGNPLSNQTVSLGSATATTNAAGEYSMQSSVGTYSWNIFGNNDLSVENVPQAYQLQAFNYVLTQSISNLDFTIPAKRVDIHIQDALGNPIENIEVVTLNGGKSVGNVDIGGGINNATSLSYYGRNVQGGALPAPKTNASGDVILWLLPSDAGNPFTIKFIPPSSSPYSEFNLTNLVISQDRTEIISLQYIHDVPVTTATLSPSPNSNDEYEDPTTVTLSATAYTGFTIASTYYTIDGGAQQTYSSPFEVTGDGEHTITYWSVDNVGVPESPNSQTFTISSAPVEVTINPSADSNVRNGHDDRNFGASDFMRVKSSGNNRALVKFDQSEIESLVGDGTVLSAKVVLTITDNGNNWGDGRTVDIHRLTLDWAEGDGTESDRGTGNGTTWNCAVDSLIENQAKNCSGSTEWDMGHPNNPELHPWIETPSDTITVTNGLTGEVEYDVTSDVQSFLNGDNSNFGWIIRKTNEGQNGSADFGTKESSSVPQLVITYQP